MWMRKHIVHVLLGCVVALCFSTLLAALTGSVRILSALGLAIVFPCLVGFAGATKLLRWFQASRDRIVKFTETLEVKLLGAALSGTARFLAIVPLSAALVLRGVFLGTAVSTADFYADLCRRDVAGISASFDKFFVALFPAMLLSLWEDMHDRGPENPGRLAVAYRVLGGLAFLLSLALLGAGLAGEEAFQHMDKLVSSGFWFVPPSPSLDGLRGVFADTYFRGTEVLMPGTFSAFATVAFAAMIAALAGDQSVDIDLGIPLNLFLVWFLLPTVITVATVIVMSVYWFAS